MFRASHAEAAVLPGDLDSLKRQRIIFTLLNLFLLSLLLFLHAWFASFWGKPSVSLTALLVVCFLLRALELSWLRGRAPSLRASAFLTGFSIVLNLALAFVLATVIDREDSQYFALLVVPILESAFRFPLAATLSVVGLSDLIAFYWVWRYFRFHPPVDIGEYFEAGTMSIIFLIVGALISIMVRHLRSKHGELMRVQQRLVEDEKLAAVGRVASAVAHEVRNPVAMISTSLATAQTMGGAEREEMLGIASREATRLVKLTNDLLAYAKPRKTAPTRGPLRDAAVYVAEACRAHAAAHSVTIQVNAPDAVTSEYDVVLAEQALMNMVINAVDASPLGAAVELTVAEDGANYVRVDVENSGGPIPPATLERLFEPFFTTKTAGTGLGLATARNVVRAQGGDVVLSSNAQRVRFSLKLPKRAPMMRAASGK